MVDIGHDSYLEVAAEVEVVDSGYDTLSSNTKPVDTVSNLNSDTGNNYDSCMKNKPEESSKLPKFVPLLSPKPTRPKMLGNLTFREIAGRRKIMTKTQTRIKHEGLNLNTSLVSILQDSHKDVKDARNKKEETIDMTQFVGKTITLNPNTSKNISIKFVRHEPSDLLKENKKLYKIDADLIFGKNNKEHITNRLQDVQLHNDGLNIGTQIKETTYKQLNKTYKPNCKNKIPFQHWDNSSKVNIHGRKSRNNVFFNKSNTNIKCNNGNRTLDGLRSYNKKTLNSTFKPQMSKIDNTSKFVQRVAPSDKLSVISAAASYQDMDGLIVDTDGEKWKKRLLERKSPLKRELKRTSRKNVPETSRILRKDTEFTRTMHRTNYSSLVKTNKTSTLSIIKNNNVLINGKNKNYNYPEKIHKIKKSVHFKLPQKIHPYKNSGLKSGLNLNSCIKTLTSSLKEEDSYSAEQFKENCSNKKILTQVSKKINLYPQKDHLLQKCVNDAIENIHSTISEESGIQNDENRQSQQVKPPILGQSSLSQNRNSIHAIKECSILLNRLYLPNAILENSVVNLLQNQYLNLNPDGTLLSDKSKDLLATPKSPNNSPSSEIRKKQQHSNIVRKYNTERVCNNADKLAGTAKCRSLNVPMKASVNELENDKIYCNSNKEIFNYLQLQDLSNDQQRNKQELIDTESAKLKSKENQQIENLKANGKIKPLVVNKNEETKIKDHINDVKLKTYQTRLSLSLDHINTIMDNTVSEDIHNKNLQIMNSSNYDDNNKCSNNSKKHTKIALIKKNSDLNPKSNQFLVSYNPGKDTNIKLIPEEEITEHSRLDAKDQSSHTTSFKENVNSHRINENVISLNTPKSSLNKISNELNATIIDLTETHLMAKSKREVGNCKEEKRMSNDNVEMIDLTVNDQSENLESPETPGVKESSHSETKNTNLCEQLQGNTSNITKKRLNKRKNNLLDFSSNRVLRSHNGKHNENPLTYLSKARQKMLKLKYLNNIEYFSSNPKDKEFIEKITSTMKQRPLPKLDKGMINSNSKDSAITQANINKNGKHGENLKTVTKSTKSRVVKRRNAQEKTTQRHNRHLRKSSNSTKSSIIASDSHSTINKYKNDRDISKGKQILKKKGKNFRKVVKRCRPVKKTVIHSTQKLNSSSLNVAALENTHNKKVCKDTPQLASSKNNADSTIQKTPDLTDPDVTELVYSLSSHQNNPCSTSLNITVQNCPPQYSSPFVSQANCNVLSWQPPMVIQHSQKSIICSNFGSPSMGYNMYSHYQPYYWIGQRTNYNVAASPQLPHTIALIPCQSNTSNTSAPVHIDLVDDESDIDGSQQVNNLSTFNSPAEKRNTPSRRRKSTTFHTTKEKRLLLYNYRKNNHNLKIKKRKLSFSKYNSCTSDKNNVQCDNTDDNVQQPIPEPEAGSSKHECHLSPQNSNVPATTEGPIINIDAQCIPEVQHSDIAIIDKDKGCFSYNNLPLRSSQLTAVEETLRRETVRYHSPGNTYSDNRVLDLPEDLQGRVGHLDTKAMKILVKLAQQNRTHKIDIVKPF